MVIRVCRLLVVFGMHMIMPCSLISSRFALRNTDSSEDFILGSDKCLGQMACLVIARLSSFVICLAVVVGPDIICTEDIFRKARLERGSPLYC